MSVKQTPPVLTHALIARLLGPSDVGRSIAGDLDEEFGERAAVDPRAARRWYRREALGVAVRSRTIARARTMAMMPRGDSIMQVFFHDLRGAVRALVKQPRFTIVAALTLAVGIAAVTSIFSVVNGVLIKPLPYPNAERLVNVSSTAPGLGYPEFPQSPDLYLYFKEFNDTFEDLAIFQARRANLTEMESPVVVDISVASPSYFSTISATFAEGRPFTAEEDLPKATPVAIVSHRFWMRHRGGKENFVGESIRIDGVLRQVVGIAPAWLDARDTPDVWIPTGFDPENPPTGQFGWNVVARLKPGVSAGTAEAKLATLVSKAMAEAGASPIYRAFINDGKYRPLVHDMKEDVVGDVRQPLWILLGTVGMVLLIACANVANLFLIRAEGRQREIAVRVALGGRRWSLVRQLLTEALVLSAIGTALGLMLSASALPAVLALAPSSIPRLDQVHLDLNVVLFAIAAAIISAVVFGLVPALRYTRPAALASLKHGGRGGTDEPARRRGRNLLVVVQTAMALMLLVGSGLLARSFSRMIAAEIGFDPANVMTFRVTVPSSSYPENAQVVRFQQDLIAKLAALPFVDQASAITGLPMANPSPGAAYEVEGHPVAAGQLPPMLHYQTVAPGAFAALGIKLFQGRDFETRDLNDHSFSIVVNRALADHYWPGQDPIGKRLRPAGGDGDPPPWLSVVGVVDSVRDEGIRKPSRPLVYFPINPRVENRALSYVVRGDHVIAQADALRKTVWALDGDLPVAAMQSMDEVVEKTRVQFSFAMITLAIAAGMALVLGAIGLYGVLSYAVSLRTREIGVRLALGASPSRVMRATVASGAAITAIGLALGLAGAAAFSRFLSGILYETPPLDPVTFAAMSGALFVVALAASYLPARKAALVSPLESMRAD